jgi:hypothetical protein
MMAGIKPDPIFTSSLGLRRTIVIQGSDRSEFFAICHNNLIPSLPDQAGITACACKMEVCREEIGRAGSYAARSMRMM